MGRHSDGAVTGPDDAATAASVAPSATEDMVATLRPRRLNEGFSMRLVTILLATAALAACNKAPEVEMTNATPQEVANKMKESGVASEMRQPGQWSTTIELVDFQAPGMPPEMLAQMKAQMGSGQKQERCVTKEEVEKLDAFIGQNNANCVFETYKVGNGTIEGKASCKPGGMTQTMTMKGTYSKTKSDMTMTSQITGAPPPMGNAKTVMNVKSERIGDCAAPKAAG